MKVFRTQKLPGVQYQSGKNPLVMSGQNWHCIKFNIVKKNEKNKIIF